MASQFDVHVVSTNIGALSNDFRPWFKVPAEGGGITILEGHYVTETAGTSLVQLVDLGTGGTVNSGTIIYKGSAVYVEGIPQELVTAGADGVFVDAGHWVGVAEGNSGTTGVISIVTCSYVMGKSA